MGNFLFQKRFSLKSLLFGSLFFYRQKAKRNNFRAFEELVFFDCGFRFPVSGFRFLVPDSGFRFPGFGVAPSLTVCLLYIQFIDMAVIQHRQT